MKRPVCLRLCLALLLVLVIGSVLSLSGMNMARANDMADVPITKDTITIGGGSERNDDDNSGQCSDNNNGNDDNNDTARETSDVKVTNEPDCPKGQEPGLFTTCMPIQSCPNQLGIGGVAINPPNTNNCVNAPVVDHPSTRDQRAMVYCIIIR